ncbi:hypothetical protein KQH61_05410 [bacterium]|nr:hypothetical protein [bacterium]MCB2179339.1 hypothetical protein [bacterium]
MKNQRFPMFRLAFLLVFGVVAIACNLSVPTDSAEDAKSLSIVISNPAGDFKVSPGEQVAITSSSVSESGISQVQLLVNGQVVATNSPQEAAAQMFVTVSSWTPTSPGSYQISVVVEDVNNQRVESAKLTVTVEEQGEEQGEEQPETPPEASADNGPTPTISRGSTSGDPTPTSEISFAPMPIIVTPMITGTPSVQFVVEEIQVQSNAKKNVTAVCPEGSQLTGGGFYSDATAGNIETSRQTNNNGWLITVNNHTNDGFTLKSLAICLSNSGGTIVTETSQVIVPSESTQVVSASCPAGSVVTGGGWHFEYDRLFAVESEQSGNGWTMRARNSGDQQGLAYVYAYCLSGTNASSYNYIETVKIGSESFKDVVVLCQSGQLVTGGGFYREIQSEFSSPIGPNATGPKYGWTAGAHNFYTDRTKEIHASVTCVSFP